MPAIFRHHSGSTIFSVALHAAIFVALTLGADLRKQPPAAQHLLIEATVVDQAFIDREQQRVAEQAQAEAQRRQEEERRAREAEDSARLAREQEQRQRDAAERAEQERVAAEAARVREQREAEVRQAEELRRLEAQREAAEQQRLADEARAREQQEAERRRREEEERQRAAEEERQRQAEAERQRRQAEAEARQQAELEADLQRQLAAEAERNRAVSSGQLDQYTRLIQNRITQNWNRPASARPGLDCMVSVTQIPSGEVINVRVGSCNGDDAVIRSIEAAVLRASPLPLPPSPALFERNLNIRFVPD